MTFLGNISPELEARLRRVYKKREEEKARQASPASGSAPQAQTSAGQPDTQHTNPPSRVSSNLEFWSIEGVQYRNGIYVVDLAKSLLDNGNAHTQDEWIALSKDAEARGDFYTGDAKLHHGLFAAIYRARNDNSKRREVEEARSFLEKQFLERWLMTSTRIAYQPSGKDIITHARNMPNQEIVHEDIAGNNEWVRDATNVQPYNALFGSNNLGEIQEVYRWISGKPARLWRINKPSKVDERVARLYADSGGAYLGCYGIHRTRVPRSGYAFAKKF